MDGFRVVRIDDILSKVDIVIAATGNKHIITRERKLRLLYANIKIRFFFVRPKKRWENS
jgi:S-adenosylhomocysteine hydrolase